MRITKFRINKNANPINPLKLIIIFRFMYQTLELQIFDDIFSLRNRKSLKVLSSIK